MFNIEADFSLAFQKTLSQIQLERECGHLLGFVSCLLRNFGCQIAGVIWPIRQNNWQSIICLPDTRGLDSWLQIEELQKKLADVDNTPSKYMKYRKIEVTYNNSPSINEFIAFKLPRLYDEYFVSENCYICLVNSILLTSEVERPGIDVLEHNHISTLIDSWAWRINHYRKEIKQACLRLRSENIDESEKTRLYGIIGTCTTCVRYMLSLRELVDVGLVTIEPQNDSKDIAIDSWQKGIFSEWHCCAPPYWPPCHKVNDELCRKVQSQANELLYWCKWWDKKKVLDLLTRVKREEKEELKKRIRELSLLSKNVIDIGLNSCLKRKSLFGFFLKNALGKQPLNEDYLSSDAPSNEELAESLSCIAKVSHYLFADLPINEDIIRSIITIISKYTLRELDVPASVTLEDIMKQAAREEPALHVLKNYYRDHFFHALEVCFLGHLLLELKLGDGTHLWEKVALGIGCVGNQKQVLRLWYLASLTHDMGYCVEVLKGTCELLKFFQNSDVLKELRIDVEKNFKNLNKKIAKKKFANYKINDNPGEDHGVISALYLEGLLKNDHNVTLSDYEPAIEAVALHNSRVHDVSFKVKPLSFLLILCDTIQEWNRPHLNFATAPTQILAWFEQQEEQRKSLVGPLKSVKVNINSENNEFKIISDCAGKDKLHFTLEYDKDINKNSGVFNLWIDSSYNLQRLDFSSLDLDIDIEYITPLYIIPGSDRTEKQYHRLQDAADKTRMTFLDPWIPRNQENDIIKNSAVEYKSIKNLEKKLDQEDLTLHLRELNKHKYLSKNIEEFHKHLQKWSRYTEDKENPDDYIFSYE